MIRSLLIVPGGETAALARALDSAADALVVDLRDADAASTADALRDVSRATATPRLLVRLKPLDHPQAAKDLAALRPARPDGFVLSAAESGADVQRLGAMLGVEEAKGGFKDGSFRIVALAETGGCLFGLNSLGRSSDRLDALGWDGEALARDIGADAAREAGGLWTDPCSTARTLTLAACADARLPAIDSVCSRAGPEAFRREAETARRDGFSAKFALDEDQVAIVNAVFGLDARHPPGGRAIAKVSKVAE